LLALGVIGAQKLPQIDHSRKPFAAFLRHRLADGTIGSPKRRTTSVLLRSLRVARQAFEEATGWKLTPDGACKGEVCIPLSKPEGTMVDVAELAEALNMPLVGEPERNLWALGPEAIGGRALTTALAPELSLPDLEGNQFRLSSLRGQKILVYAWAPY
jgi:hypothetical protein